MTPAARMRAAVVAGKAGSEFEWCTNVLASVDPRATTGLKLFAACHLAALKAEVTGGDSEAPAVNLGWAEKLRDRELAGEKLCYAQQKAWRQALKYEGQ